MTAASGYAGFKGASDGSGDFNAFRFLVQQAIKKIDTSCLVQVISVTNNGGLSAVGFVDVQIMVNQVDGAGVPTPHGIVHNLPYFRLQGGANAVIIDPQVDDIGAAIFASHDISSVKATRTVSNPGSSRRFDIADGLYIGGYLNGAPTQYIQFSDAGIKVSSPTAIEMDAPVITINGNINTTGTITNNGKRVDSTHEHIDVAPGGGTSGPPA